MQHLEVGQDDELEVGQVLGISERTLFRRPKEFNMEDTCSKI